MRARGDFLRCLTRIVLVVGAINVAHVVTAEGAGAADPLTRFVDAAAHPSGRGVYLLDRDGGIQTRGDAVYRGSLPERRVPAVAAALVVRPNGNGYWIFDTAGGVHAFGDAPYLGSPAGTRGPGASVIAAAGTPSGQGYLVLDAAGGVHAFGDAPYLGSLPGLRDAGVPIGDAPGADIDVAHDGQGYFVMDAEGGIFTFGSAAFRGSLPGLRASGVPVGPAGVRDLVVAGGGGGYWVTDAFGGIFTFGTVRFHGSAPERGRPFPLVATAVIPDGSGYWMLDGDGTMLGFGAADGDGGTGGFVFIETNPDGSPVRLNPCRQIPFVVHVGSGAPVDAHGIVAEAFARLGQATGMSFVDWGDTSESFSLRTGRPWWNHPSYGPGMAPLLVSFEAPNGENGLGSRDAGLTIRQTAGNASGQRVAVAGAIVVNTAFGLGPDFSDAGSYGAVLLHELGHVIGLDHVEDTRQIMSAVLIRGNPGSYQDGDRRGLAAVGAGSGCVQDPQPG